MATTRTTKPDSVAAEAVDAARAALAEVVDDSQVGEHLGVQAEDGKVVTHFFAATQPGYRGWRWSVTVARAPRQKVVTVDEIVLLPGEDALLAPAWVPWRERIRPGDLSPGDILPPDEDDERLVPALTGADDAPDPREVRRVSEELGLGRSQVLSPEGRDQAAQRWYDGAQGPDSPLASAAPGSCGTCGFSVRLTGPLGRLFAVCANEFANDDGKVVAIDHGCGAHSEAQLTKKQQPRPLPKPVFDTVVREDLDTF